MGQRFLYVHMFAKLHCCHRSNSVCMIRSGYGNSIQRFTFLIQHFTKILVTFSVWILLPHGSCLPVVHVAKHSNFSLATFKKIVNITGAFATHTYTGHDQFITGRNKPAT